MRAGRCLRAVALALLSASAVAAAEDEVVIRAGTLLDGRGGSARDAWITVRGGRIGSVATRPRASAAAVTHDLGRYTVLPGLVDAHDHLYWHFNAAGKLHTADDGETPAQGALCVQLPWNKISVYQMSEWATGHTLRHLSQVGRELHQSTLRAPISV